jgi:hypothetical protein
MLASQNPAVSELQQLLKGLDQARATREHLEEQLSNTSSVCLFFISMVFSICRQTMNDAAISAKLLAAGNVSLETSLAALLSEFDPLNATIAKAISDSNELLQRTKVRPCLRSRVLMFSGRQSKVPCLTPN